MSTTIDDNRMERRQRQEGSGNDIDNFTGQNLTFRTVVVGLSVGVLINLTNTYFGLRVGAGERMSMVSGLLGFVIFKIGSPFIKTPFTRSENVLLITLATATGCMPMTAGFVGMIPALEYIIGPDESGPIRMDFGSLVLWSLGLAFFGVIFASMFREHFVEREKLPWPGANATAHVINILHHYPQKPATTPGNAAQHPTRSPTLEEDHDHSGQRERESLLVEVNGTEWKSSITYLMRASITSGILTILMYFIPVLHAVPIFGFRASKTWLWNVDLSPGFLGQGIVIGPVVAFHMVIGAVVGWGILSPYAKHQGFATGEVDDWETGSRGWIIWVSLAALFADASVKLSWFLIRSIWSRFPANGLLHGLFVTLPKHRARQQLDPPVENETNPLIASMDDESSVAERTGARGLTLTLPSSSPGLSHLSREHGPGISPMLALVFMFSIILCILVVHLLFGRLIPWYYTLAGILLSLPMAVVGIRSIAEIDYNPESALVSQLAFAALVSHSNPNAVVVNLISAAIAQAGANQSGDLAYDLKIGSLIGAKPETQLHGQIIGSIFGALISCGIYKLYAAHYPIPGPLFRVPSSYLVLSTARLLLGRGLPRGVTPFAVGAGILSTLATITKMRYASRWWQSLIPSGVTFAMGIYLTPSFTITRAVGGLCYWAYMRRKESRRGNIIIVASGLILGESIASLVSVALTALRVPQLWGE